VRHDEQAKSFVNSTTGLKHSRLSKFCLHLLIETVIHIFQFSLQLHLNQSSPWPAWQTDKPRDNFNLHSIPCHSWWPLKKSEPELTSCCMFHATRTPPGQQTNRPQAQQVIHVLSLCPDTNSYPHFSIFTPASFEPVLWSAWQTQLDNWKII